MGRPRIDISGETHNGILVISRNEVQTRKFICQCVCLNLFSTTKQRLLSGKTKSCGCLKNKLSSEANTKHGASKGGKNCATYQSYVAMMNRCYNKKRSDYEYYGGAGILVEETSWLLPSPTGYLNFLNDMGERPEGTSLDRINGEIGYYKSNCRWSSRRIQAVNTRRKKTDKNSSKYRGVSLRKTNGKFMARIGDGKGGYEWLGEFEIEKQAAQAYNKRAKELFADDAKLNEID